MMHCAPPARAREPGVCEARGRHGADAARAPGRPSAAPACTRRSTRNMCNERVLAAGSSPSGPMTTRASTTRAAHYTTPQEQAQLSAYFTRLRIQVSRRAHLARFRARARAGAPARAPARWRRAGGPAAYWVWAAVYQCRFEAPAAHRPCTPAVKRHARARARSHCDRSVSPRHRRSPRGGGLLAAQRHSDDAARVHLEVDSRGRCAAVAGHGLVIQHELARLAASGRIGRC